MMTDHEEFEVETDRVGELPMPFWSETVRQVVVDVVIIVIIVVVIVIVIASRGREPRGTTDRACC